ncbi:hypothetical protein ACFLVC_03870 [Chloroflexota bacterium]
MTTGSIIAFSQDIPIFIPIVVLVLGLGMLGFGIVRTNYRIKVWNKLQNLPELDDVLQKALEIHKHITELSKNVIKENKKKNIKTKVRIKLANEYFKTLNISIIELTKNIQPDGTISKKLYKKIKKRQHLKDGEYYTVIPMLKDFARVLNKSKLGLRQSITNNSTYDKLHGEYLALQLKLNVPDSIMHDINSLPELSYGLNSVYIGINLINENRNWINDVPDSILVQQEDSDSIVTKSYMRASMWLKNKVKMAIFNEVVK